MKINQVQLFARTAIIGAVTTISLIYQLNWLHDQKLASGSTVYLLASLIMGLGVGLIYYEFLLKAARQFKFLNLPTLTIAHLPTFLLWLYPLHLKLAKIGPINRHLPQLVLFLTSILLLFSFGRALSKAARQIALNQNAKKILLTLIFGLTLSPLLPKTTIATLIWGLLLCLFHLALNSPPAMSLIVFISFFTGTLAIIPKISLPFHNPYEIIGPLANSQYNPNNDLIRFGLLLAIPSLANLIFTLLFRLFKIKKSTANSQEA